MNAWFAEFASRQPLPTDYLSLDVEATGTSPTEDLVIQIGYVLVEGCQIRSSGVISLNWLADDLVAADVLRYRLTRTKTQMEYTKGGQPTGRHFPFDIDDLKKRGVHPADALSGVAGLVEDCVNHGYAFVMHAGILLDMPMLKHLWSCMGSAVSFGSEVFDTGAMEIASQLGSQTVYWETPLEFSERIIQTQMALPYKTGPRLYWNLDRHCAKKYDLPGRYNLDMSLAHDAGFDSILTHHLFETFRLLSQGVELWPGHESVPTPSSSDPPKA